MIKSSKAMLAILFFTQVLFCPINNTTAQDIDNKAKIFFAEFAETRDRLHFLLTKYKSGDPQAPAKFAEIQSTLELLFNSPEVIFNYLVTKTKDFALDIGIKIPPGNSPQILVLTQKLSPNDKDDCAFLSHLFFNIITTLDVLDSSELYSSLIDKLEETLQVDFIHKTLKINTLSKYLDCLKEDLFSHIIIKFIIRFKNIFLKLNIILSAFDRQAKIEQTDNSRANQFTFNHRQQSKRCKNYQNPICYEAVDSSEDLFNNNICLYSYLSNYDKKTALVFLLCLNRLFKTYNCYQKNIILNIISFLPYIPSKCGVFIDSAQTIYPFLDWQQLFSLYNQK